MDALMSRTDFGVNSATAQCVPSPAPTLWISEHLWCGKRSSSPNEAADFSTGSLYFSVSVYFKPFPRCCIMRHLKNRSIVYASVRRSSVRTECGFRFSGLAGLTPRITFIKKRAAQCGRQWLWCNYLHVHTMWEADYEIQIGQYNVWLSR